MQPGNHEIYWHMLQASGYCSAIEKESIKRGANPCSFVKVIVKKKIIF
jgi:hypothetical protein